MNIAFDTSPLTTGHSIRGSGFYVEYLKKSFLKYFPEHNYRFFSRGEKAPSDYDVIHFPYFDPFFLTLPFHKQRNSIVTAHDLIPIKFSKYFPSGIKGYVKWQIQKRNLKKVDAIITDSHSSANDLKHYLGLDQNNIFVIPLAAGEIFKKMKYTDKKIHEMQKKYSLPSKFVLYVGDVTWNKNLPRLVEAIQSLDIPFVLVGKALVNRDYDTRNPWNADLVKVQKMIGDSGKIKLLGFVPDEELVALYNMASVFVMPSLYEGFGLPVLEALSCGCPVVTSKEGSLYEVGGESVCYVDAYDAHSIADTVSKIYFNDGLKHELSEKALNHAKNFSWEKTAAATIKVYESVIKK